MNAEKKRCYDDMKYMLEVFEEKHPDLYRFVSKDVILQMIEDFSTDESINSVPQYLYYMKKVIKLFNDPHITIDDSFVGIPLIFKVINEKVYVIDTLAKEYNDIKFSELKSINGIEIEQIIKEIETITSYTALEWLKNEIENKLFNLSALRELPSLINAETFDYFFELDGEIKKTFNVYEKFDYSLFKRKFYDVLFDIKNQIIKIDYARCRSNPDYPFDEFMKDIINLQQQTGVTDFVIDLRKNQGGDSEVIRSLLKFLKDKNIITIVNEEVFSSGSLAAIELRDMGSKIVGTRIGTTLNNYGEVEKVILPNTRLNGRVSQKYYWYDNSISSVTCVNKEEYSRYFANGEHSEVFVPQVFEPDFYIEPTIEDYKNGVDIQYITAVEKLKKIKKLEQLM